MRFQPEVRAPVWAKKYGGESQLAKVMNRLSARSLPALLAKPGLHADGGGLYLNTKGGARWVFIYRRGKKRTEMGLGSASPGHVSLRKARDRASTLREQLGDDVDPLKEKRTAPRVVPTFGSFAATVISALSKGFSNTKHAEQWTSSLETHATSIWNLPVNEIGTSEVLGVLDPIWEKVPETASRVRGRIERILNAAKVDGYREGENPARWRGHLDHRLSKRQRLSRGHHPALPYSELPAFTVELRSRRATAARALEFLILSATRSNEARGARWGEFDFEKETWTIPAVRMKAKRSHRVPLTPRMVAILNEVRSWSESEFVFPGPNDQKPLSEGAFKTLLDRMGRGDITPHGFRSTFRDWASEETHFSNEVQEMALAHRIRDETEAAYRRGDLLDKRRELMLAWADYGASALDKTGSR
jgi:integrase